MEDLKGKLSENCIPVDFMVMEIFDHALFLDIRH